MLGGMILTTVLLFFCMGADEILPEAMVDKLSRVLRLDSEEQPRVKEKSPQCWNTAGDKDKIHYI